MSLLLTLFLCIIFLLDLNSATTFNQFLPSSHPTTIPALPEQSSIEGCPLTLSNEFFEGIKNACSVTKNVAQSELHRSRCCPVLAAWLYSAYSTTALGKSNYAHNSTSYVDMPLMPDDSETCVSGLEKALNIRGIELTKPNETCDMVFCYCGIRLHPFNCPEAFSVTQKGELVGDASVRRLEKNCLSSSKKVNGFPGLGGCSKCLNSLYSLNKKTSSLSKAEDNRTTTIHNKDCELMGLTWLLSKNRTAYLHTVSGVLRALLLNTGGSHPQSCSLNSDGMPLAVDSSEINDHSSSTTQQPPIFLSWLPLCLLLSMYVSLTVLFS